MVAGIGALLSGIGSIAGAFTGAEAQSQANKTNQMINIINWMLRQQERADAIRVAEQNRTTQFEGTTDAAGNRVRYVPGRGWVTDLSPRSEALRQMQTAEQVRTLMQDLPMRRALMKENIDTQAKERAFAENILAQLERVQPTDPKRLEDRMALEATRGVNNEYDEITNMAMRDALRTGSSNIDRILRSIGKERAASRAAALAGIPGQARQQAAAIDQGKKGPLANLYNMFMSRASAMPGVSYAPQNVEGTANQFLNPAANRGLSAMQSLISTNAKQGGTFDYIQPDDYFGKALATAGSAVGNIFDAFSGQKEKDRIYDLYQKRFAAGGGW